MRWFRTSLVVASISLLSGCNLIPMPPGGVRGTVVNGETPVSNAGVQATVIGEESVKNWVSGRPSNQTTSKADGAYYLDNMHPGEFSVSVNWNGKVLVKQATVKSGNDTFLNFDMGKATASVN